MPPNDPAIAGKSKKGGRRKGAGRKPKPTEQLREKILEAVDRKLYGELDTLIENMMHLARGGYQRVEQVLKPSRAAKGKRSRLVVVERKVSVAEPDRAANIYLIDRVLGRPKQSVEMSGKDGGAVPLTIEAALQKAYGDPEPPQS